jgi:hypothetical protein
LLNAAQPSYSPHAGIGGEALRKVDLFYFAMEAGVSKKVWEIEDIVSLLDKPI